ncbi:DUF5590 domain-containing protein [Salipaludibacillus sp. CF4.18]|uniref:cell wall elongation regulator TseB-like domain-containing protein n=1 Tax=Salipaludibacillus sp. CF4.18 TaxID=3373081 RepID=UPI003EE7C684
MKAWIMSISIMIIVGFLAFGYYLYQVTTDPLEARENVAIQLAGEQVDIAEVREAEYYHGRRSYQVVDAIDSEGNELYIWVEEVNQSDEDESNESEVEPTIVVRDHTEGLTKDEVTSLSQEELSMSRLKSVRLGMIGSTPVYEVNYLDDTDRHSFYYVTFEDGTYIRHYNF